MKTTRRTFLWKTLGVAALAPLATQCTYDVLPPLLEVLYPNGGEQLVPQAGSVIRWKAVNVGPLLLEFSADDGKTWIKIAEDVPPEPEFWEWQLPRVNSAACRIRISEMENAELQDESNAVFGIQPVLKLTYPNGGELLKAGGKSVIRWEAAGVESLRIELSTNNGLAWMKLAEQLSAATGALEWEVPVRSSDQCRVRITDVADPTVQDENDAFFSIRVSETILLAEHPELQQVDGFKVFDNTTLGGIAVLVTGMNTFQVLSLSCTHAGCGVYWDSMGFQCPCHGSAFDKKGCVLAGPATEPLWNYDYTFDAGQQVLTVLNRLKTGAC
jgi:Rieske Fe-S protein